MKCAVAAAVFGLFGLSIVAPAMAQGQPTIAPNPRIVPKYNPPTTDKYQAVYGRLQQRKVLEDAGGIPGAADPAARPED